MNKTTPTLFIALGGTGAEIALRLRRRILSHAWGDDGKQVTIDSLDQFPLAQFIYYDLDVCGESRSTEYTERFSEEETFISKLDIGKYFRNDGEICKYPLIDEWSPISRRTWLELNSEINHVKGQIRALSRLYFFDKYYPLKNRMVGKIKWLLQGVSSLNKTSHLRLTLEPASLRVVVIASTAGGTGSGAFIDMGYLAKVLAGIELPYGNRKVDLCLMLPSWYSDHGKTRSQANTYAALMELESCMDHGLQFVRGWKDNEDLVLPDKPYDDIFLFDTCKLASIKKQKVTDLFDVVADTLFEDFIPSDFTSRKSRNSIHQMQWKIVPFTSPVDVHKFGSMKMKYSKAYSAFGHSVIETQIEQHTDEIACGQVNGNPLITMLEEMDSSERRSLFQDCLESAMPWVDANVEGIWAVDPDQYMCVVGVDGAAIFAQKYGDEFKSVVPARAGMPTTKINFYESGIPGKLTCYVELSGLPLTALNQLPQWRASYDVENKKIPVHIHKNRSLFVHPLAPTSNTLALLAEHFKLFIQGVVLGVLNLRREDPEMYVYCLRKNGVNLSIGSERLIRLDGLAGQHLDLLQTQVTDALERLNTLTQHAGLVAMFDYYAQYVYPPATVRDEGRWESLQEGFANIMCRQLGEEAQKVLEKKFADADFGLLVRLKGYGDEELSDNFNALDVWTDEIEGSVTDVYEYEVGKYHKPKRMFKPEFFQEGWMERQFHVPGNEKPSPSCLSCGSAVEASYKFCTNCGARQKLNDAVSLPLQPV